MEYLKARREDLGQVYQLVQDTIQTIYPQYYPHEIVGFLVIFTQRKLLPLISTAAMYEY